MFGWVAHATVSVWRAEDNSWEAGSLIPGGSSGLAASALAEPLPWSTSIFKSSSFPSSVPISEGKEAGLSDRSRWYL